MYVPYVIVYDDEPTICSLVSLTDYDSINSIIYSSLFVGNENPLWLVVPRRHFSVFDWKVFYESVSEYASACFSCQKLKCFEHYCMLNVFTHASIFTRILLCGSLAWMAS